MLLRDRARHRRAPGGARLDGLRERPAHGVDRRPGRAGLQDAGPGRHRRGVDAGGGGRGRGGRGSGGRAGQQRRLQPVGRRRDAAAGPAQGAVRDQRLRARPHVPARPARDAPPGRGQDRQRQLDGRQADLPGRRRLPRDQARGRGALGRAALRGARVRRRRGRDRAGADQDALRRDRRGLDRRRRRRRATTPTRSSTPPSAPRPRRSTRGRWRASAAARRPSPGRSSGRSPRGGRRPATR